MYDGGAFYASVMAGTTTKKTATIFIECRRCGHKAQKEVTQLELPAGARWRCSTRSA